MCVCLVGLVVFLYYRRVRMVLLMAWAVFNGVAWVFALTELKIGYLNTQTAFLGSIIIGNGINYSLILMARYLEERRHGHAPLDSLVISMKATMAGTLASSITTGVSFGVLVITSIKGFSQFGFIGGVGMFLCWVATYTVLPVFLSISENLWPVKAHSYLDQFSFSPMDYLARWLTKWSPEITKSGLTLLVISLPLIAYYVPHSLEYDFTKLRVQNKGAQVSEEADLNNRVKKIFGTSMTPAVLATDRLDQVQPLCDEIMRKNALDLPEARVVDNCKTVFSYIPPDQDKKIEKLADIRKMLDDNTLNFLNEEQKKQMEEFKSNFNSQKIALKDLPDDLTKIFREKNGDLGKLVYVYPTDKAPLTDGKNLIKFADLISYNKLPNGDVITGSGDSAIFADLLRAVIKYGPIATILAFIGVCLVVIIIFREIQATIFIIGTLVAGVVWLGGLMSIGDIKINFFNFIAIPTTFGIGVDYGVNIYQRYKLEGRSSLPKVLATTGGAVALCSITTIIGYFTLIIAKNQALVSFGWIGIWGEVTCIVAALIFIPAVVMRLESREG